VRQFCGKLRKFKMDITRASQSKRPARANDILYGI
jgi:hypothetical protein